MIEKLTIEYQKHERDINVLVLVLVVLWLILVGRAMLFTYERNFEELWSLLAPAIPVIAAILVARVASRLIVNGQIIREDERRQDIVRISHHLIAITKDLKNRVSFVAKALEGGTPMLAILQITESIENRYETLLERESYKYLPGSCVDIITSISGSIYGISLLSASFKQVAASSPIKALESTSNQNFERQISQLNNLVVDLQKLLDELFVLRYKVNLP